MMNYFLLNKKSKYNFFYIKIVKIKQQKITNFKIFIKINIYIYIVIQTLIKLFTLILN